MSIVKDISLAPSGHAKMEWVKSHMPVLGMIGERFEREHPFSGMTIAMSIHLEAKTARLALTLAAGGARVFATGCNPLSTQDDVAAALSECGVETFAVRGVNEAEYEKHLVKTLECEPDMIIDDGGDLLKLLHGEYAPLARNIRGGCEETTTGVARMRARAAAKELCFPMFAVNNANCKHLFDNRHGTGQSVWDAIMNTTNCLIAGKNVVVAGYGFCGRGVALRAHGLGANIIICETNPFRALEASADGYRVMTMDNASALGDIFVTTTGCRDILRTRHFERMKDGAMLANAGHFDVEINKDELMALALKKETRKPNIEGYYLKDGRVLNLLGEGRLVNLAAGNGHPAEIMDMSFAIQALMMEHIAKLPSRLAAEVYPVPPEIDEAVARAKLAAAGIEIDALSGAQEKYLKSF